MLLMYYCSNRIYERTSVVKLIADLLYAAEATYGALDVVFVDILCRLFFLSHLSV